VAAVIDWASLAWDHPNRHLTELIRQAAWRRLTSDPFAARGLPGRLHAAGWDDLGVEPVPLVELSRSGLLLALAEQAANWAVEGVRCTPPQALAWSRDLREAADGGYMFAHVTALLVRATRSGL